MIQLEALDILKSGANVFLTGPAGSGKTFVLNKFAEYLKKEKIRAAVTASTGIAATHLGGLTIHSWAGIGIKESLTRGDIEEIMWNEKVAERINAAKVLIIDEISMLPPNVLEMVNHVCQAVRQSVQPFGGLQFVACGDFFQLPPVTREDQIKKFAFESEAWQKAGLTICYLEEQHRQEDQDYLRILNEIRGDKVSDWAREKLNSRLRKNIDGWDKPTKLYTHNIDVDRINKQELHKIIAKPKTYEMSARGPKKLVENLTRGCLAPEELVLKVGAIVMFVRNKFANNTPIYVNGTMGRVAGFSGTNMPIIQTKNGKVEAERASWTIEEGGQTKAEIIQLPLKLAWAITIHKSQGLSMDCAEIDLSGCFEPGMGYVALSRVRTLDGLKLLGLNDLSLRVSERILEFDKEIRKI
ncbi:MAG TPA: PIF1 family DEAD/DEAH box helicase [Candidatus Nanoarchaeia archaeon]|nr:PIF1 family DEAD/DEAH box helicase [Candidatus Nanoarchaeia archaeon]